MVILPFLPRNPLTQALSKITWILLKASRGKQEKGHVRIGQRAQPFILPESSVFDFGLFLMAPLLEQRLNLAYL